MTKKKRYPDNRTKKGGKERGTTQIVYQRTRIFIECWSFEEAEVVEATALEAQKNYRASKNISGRGPRIVLRPGLSRRTSKNQADLNGSENNEGGRK